MPGRHTRRLTCRTTRLARSVGAALAIALAAPPGFAGERYWTFIGGCGSADWVNTNGVPNAQGRHFCWSETLGGLSGMSTPTAADNVHIVAPTATQELLVSFALPTRPAFTGQARDLEMYGSSAFAAGLSMDRHALSTSSITLGLAGTALLGRMDQSGGAVTTSSLQVLSGGYRLSGGSLLAGELQLRSQFADAQFVQSGGVVTAGTVGLGSIAGAAASFSQLAGTLNSTTLAIGTLGGTGATTVAVDGPTARWNNNGALQVGQVGNGALDIRQAGRMNTDSATVGLTPLLSSGRITVADAGSSLTVGGLLLVGDGGNGLLVAENGATVTTASAVFNGTAGAPQSAPGLAAVLQGAGTVVDAAGALVVGRDRGALVQVGSGATLRSALGSVGQFVGAPGSVTLDGATWVNATSLVVGAGGTGEVAVNAASQLRSPMASVGSQTGSQGTVTVSGAQSVWLNAGLLTVGERGRGNVEVDQQGRVDSGSTVLGSDGGPGTLMVTGAGSRWDTGALTVGRSGVDNGAVVLDGGTLAATSVLVGETMSGQGLARVAGSGSWLDVAGVLTLGRQGAGLLLADHGARLDSASAVLGEQVGSTGSATVEGGATWNNTGTLQVGAAGQGFLHLGSGATLGSGRVTLGQLPVGQGTLTLFGPGTRLATSDALQVGFGGQGAVWVEDGAELASASAALASGAGSRGDVSVSGAGSAWRVAGALDIAPLGQALLTVDGGGLVQVGGNTSAAAGGRLLLDGGTLRSGAVALGAPGRLDWRSGVLNVTGAAGVALDGTALPAQLALTAGRTLQVDHILTVGPDAVLLLSGGRLQAGTLLFDRGVIASTDGGVHTLDLDDVLQLQAQGLIGVRVRGDGTSGLISALGPLTMGQASSTAGYAFRGTLDLGGHQVVLLDGDLAMLGVTTLLGDGAQLATVNGAWQAGDGRMVVAGNASVQGRFVNDGAVDVNGSGLLSFHNLVTGTGSFSGPVRFLAGYAPGGGAVAQTRFGGGPASFGADAVLSLDVAGPAPGTGFDQLLDIGALSFAGTLALSFADGFAADGGATLQLLQFDSFSGQLDAGRVVVSGFDAARLDFSRLALDGTLSITAVPEPGTAALWAAGLAVVLGCARRRRVWG